MSYDDNVSGVLMFATQQLCMVARRAIFTGRAAPRTGSARNCSFFRDNKNEFRRQCWRREGN